MIVLGNYHHKSLKGTTWKDQKHHNGSSKTVITRPAFITESLWEGLFICFDTKSRKKIRKIDYWIDFLRSFLLTRSKWENGYRLHFPNKGFLLT